MPDCFTEATAVHTVDHDRFVAEVPDGWQQGRGAFGGFGVGLAVRALAAREPDRPLRALTAELPGPLTVGEAQIETRVLRRGTGMTSLEATVTQDDEVKVRATGLFGTARDVDVSLDAEPPELTPSFDDIPPIPEGALPPRFIEHYELRLTGTPPFTGAAEATAAGWVRLRVPPPVLGAPEVAGLVDVFWPTLFSTLTAPRPMATVTFTLQLTEAAYDLDPRRPLYFRSRGIAASAGYLSELRELWTEDGRLVALNPQTFVVIK